MLDADALDARRRHASEPGRYAPRVERGDAGRPNVAPRIDREDDDTELKTKEPRATPARSPERSEGLKGADESGDEEKGRFSRRPSLVRRHPLVVFASVAGLGLAAGGGCVYWENATHYESTDDAFVASRQTAIAPKITGYVAAVPVTDNQHVSAGDLIARIDDRDYRVSLDQTDAQIASARASIANCDAQINVQQKQIEANQAQVEQAQASLQFAKQQAARYDTLAQHGFGTVQNAQQYSSQLNQNEASLKSALANLSVAERQIDALKAQRASAVASLDQAKASRGQALLNLSYARIEAAEAGRIVNLSAEPGELAQPGTNLTMFVPDEIWIVANFKETQLDKMRPSQAVEVSVDAYPDHPLKGHIASVQPGSGTAFSLLPAQNATGNYVKVVQRVPVKIVIDNPPSDLALGPGMSVVPTVRTDPTPSLYEKLASWIANLRRES